MKTGIEDKFIIKDGKKLRYGYTTGSCAAAAASAAATYLLTGRCPEYVSLRTPEGTELFLEPVTPQRSEHSALCGITKDAGDDPDVTNGITVFAEVEKTSEGVWICGGEGVGRVTRKGLEQSIGDPAINKVPRQMIRNALLTAAAEHGYTGGFRVTVSVPGGDEIAGRTFNPKLGIEGGISILGTSGLVKPMSEAALIDTIRLQISQKAAEGQTDIVMTPGNYGRDYLDSLGIEDPVMCSNFVGETIDAAVQSGIERILYVSHIGKGIKVAGGIMNTHSKMADCRAEIMAASALRAGADRDTALAILDTITTDESIEILKRKDMLEDVMEIVMEEISHNLSRRAEGKIRIESILFSNEHGTLGKTSGADAYLEEIRERTSQDGK